MRILSNYIKNGRGCGLSIVMLLSLALSIFWGILSYSSAQATLNHPTAESFFATIPTFEIKNGVAQDNNIRWHQMLAFPNGIFTISIDTSVDEISLPVPDGVYITRSAAFVVGQNGESTEKLELPDMIFSPELVRSIIRTLQIAVTILVSILIFILGLMIYLAIVAITAISTCALKIDRMGSSLWKICALTWALFVLALLAIVLTKFSINIWLLLLATIILNLIVLTRLSKKA